MIFDTYHLSNGWICNPDTMKEVAVQHLSSYACHWPQQSSTVAINGGINKVEMQGYLRPRETQTNVL